MADIPLTIASERAIVGLCLLDRDVIDRVLNSVGPDDFSDNSLGYIFRLLKAWHENDKSWTWEEVADALLELDDRPRELEFPISYMSDLVASEPALKNLGSHIENMRRRRVRLHAAEKLDLISTLVKDPSKTYDEIKRSIQSVEDLFEEQHDLVEVLTPANVLPWFKETLQEMYEMQFIGSGFSDFDSELVWGFAEQMTSLITGRTSMGKSLLRLNIEENFRAVGIPYMTISREQSLRQEIGRRICLKLGISMRDFVHVKQWESKKLDDLIIKGMRSLATGNYFKLVVPTGFYSTKDVRRSILDCIKEGHHPKVVFIDLFAQLDDVNVVTNQALVINQKIIEIANLARQLKTHICMVVQLRRMGKDRDKLDKREQLKGSGGYEERVDLAIMVNRPAYYNPTKHPNNKMEVHILKQRDGGTPQIDLAYEPEYFRLANKRDDSDDPDDYSLTM